eukprot:12911665-Prorocentrum_lima.AAC.1
MVATHALCPVMCLGTRKRAQRATPGLYVKVGNTVAQFSRIIMFSRREVNNESCTISHSLTESGRSPSKVGL